MARVRRSRGGPHSRRTWCPSAPAAPGGKCAHPASCGRAPSPGRTRRAAAVACAVQSRRQGGG
eukprot:5954464-Prymnesium_polylepis.1